MQFNYQSPLPNQSLAGHQPGIYLPSTQAISSYSTRLMCAGIIALNCLGIHTGCVQTSFGKSYPEPLVNQGSLPPEEADGPFQSWKGRNKYFLVVAVNETGLPNTDLPFTQADATEIATALSGLGYEPLDSDHPILTGKEATRSAIIKSVKTSYQGKSDNDIIAIYFTGHGSVGTKDLWLQTFGQEELGEGQGIALSELITRTRFKEGKPAFEGELVIIVDTCFSGQGVLSQSLTMGELGRKTTIFSASTKKQESYLLQGPDLPHMSAFTFSLLQAMGPQWADADWDGDGMLRYPEIQIFAKNLLKQLWKEGKIEARMEPELYNPNQEQFLAYRRDQVRTLNTPYRLALQTEEVSKALAAHLQSLEGNPQKIPALPKKAEILARGLAPEPGNFYGKALQATAEGNMTEARKFFAEAEEHIHKNEQHERDKRHALSIARARMETYAGKFTEAFSWYQKAAAIRSPTAPDLINEIGLAGLRAGKYLQAEPYLLQALQLREQDLDPTHPDLAGSLNNLAELYRTQGRYTDADHLLQGALRISETALGADHPQVAVTLNNMAALRYSQGQYAEAEPLYQRALRIDEAALGKNHPDVARDLNNLAELYRTQGKYADAELLYQRALHINKLVLGANHPQVALNLNNLAEQYRTQGRYTDADHLLQGALRISETALGADHPQVAVTLNNMAALRYSQGQYAEAEPLYLRALRISEQALGDDHPQVALTLNNLAELYRIQGRYSSAQPLYQRALRISEQALGADHPDAAMTLGNLGNLYHSQGQYIEAEPLLERAYRIQEMALGAEHPNVAMALNNLAALYYDEGQYAKAEPLLQHARQIQEAALGPNHPDVAITLSNLAKIYQTQGQYADAEPLYQKSYWIFSKGLGPDHPHTTTVFGNYQEILKTSGQAYDEDTVFRKLQQAQESQASPVSSSGP